MKPDNAWVRPVLSAVLVTILVVVVIAGLAALAVGAFIAIGMANYGSNK